MTATPTTRPRGTRLPRLARRRQLLDAAMQVFVARGYHAAAMIEPRVDDLLENVDSRYALVIVAAKRARQINNYHHQLGEGTFGDNLPPLVESRSMRCGTSATARQGGWASRSRPRRAAAAPR